MIILDTNVISELMKAKPDANVQAWLMRVTTSPFVTTAISIYEIEFGLRQLPDGKRKTELYARFEGLISSMNVLPLDDRAAIKAGQFRSGRKAAGFNVSSSDLMIAGIAASVGTVLATRNTKDFEGLSLQLADPWQAN
jgi:predicted nucleic acid-binding protein